MIEMCDLNMKQSFKHSTKQTRRLVQYSSGEDDSGAEDIFTREDVQFRSCLNRPIDLKLKKTVSQPFLKQSRSRKGMIDNGSINTHSSPRSDCCNARRTSGRLITSIFLPNSLKTKQHSKSVQHRSPIVRARLWSEHNIDISGSVTDSITIRGTQYSCKPQPELCRSTVVGDRVPFSLHRSTKNPVNIRKVLSDITRETVPDFQFQIPSYFSRDVLPVDSEDSSKLEEYFNTKNTSSNNNHFVNNINTYESTGNGTLPRTRSGVIQNSVDMSKEFKTTEEKGWFSLHYQKVSMFLVIFVLVFFVGVGLLYLNMRYKDTPGKISDYKGNKYPVCDHEPHQDNCIENNELQAVIGVLQVLSPHLMVMARNAMCNSSRSVQSSMSDAEFLDFVMIHHTRYSYDDAQNILKNLKLLVLANPHWDITILQNNSNYTTDANYVQNMNQGHLTCKNPLLPISCRMKLLVTSILTWVSSITAVFVAVSGVLFGLWNYKCHYDQHRQEVYIFVNQIISAVKNHHQRIQASGLTGIPYIPVEVCRSEIFSTKPAQSISSAWEDAVKFIDVHESRILTDVLEIHGKPTKVWQWLSSTAPLPTAKSVELCSNSDNRKTNTLNVDSRNLADSTVNPNVTSSGSRSRKKRRNKVWQGQAFETIAGSPNSLPCSPTPCLKIRHMFDPDLEHGDDWPILIEDSILEKCEDVCVLHLYVDCSSQEGCVFMKCSSPDEAGKAYRALHGWWFDTKLVTVKYLRVERYHERFPEAANVSSPLRPSNNQRLSLQELWHLRLESP